MPSLCCLRPFTDPRGTAAPRQVRNAQSEGDRLEWSLSAIRLLSSLDLARACVGRRKEQFDSHRRQYSAVFGSGV